MTAAARYGGPAPPGGLLIARYSSVCYRESLHVRVLDRSILPSVIASLCLVVPGACAPTSADPGVTPAPSGFVANCAPDNAGLTLPAGFCANIFADSIGRARGLVVASNGDVYVAIEGTRRRNPADTTRLPPPVSFVALRDGNGDGRADMIQRVGSTGNTGIALFNGYIYVDEGTRIVRYRRSDSELAPTGSPEVIVEGIPLNPGHRARNFAIAADGSMYVNIGSPSNSCQEKDRTTESRGADPCTELLTRAGVWRFDASRTNQTFSPEARYATGLRNSIALAFAPGGRLYAVPHGRDQLTANWPKVFPDTGYQAENPAEEMVQVSQGDDFGWPYCYYAMDRQKRVTAPEYGGDGTRSERCDRTRAPVAVFPAHWAPMTLLFYSGSNFPARYRNGAFISFHGSWNRAPRPQAGYNVVFQPMSNGVPSGAFETFADGFAGVPPSEIQPNRAKHRPVGLGVGPDGALYISDDVGGRIYRITYTGAR